MGSYLFHLIAVLILSVNNVVSKMAADSIGAAEIGFYRWLVAAVLFTPFLLPSIWRQRADIRPLLPRLIVLGMLGMVIYQSLAYYAAHMTSATHMGLIGSLTPMMVLGLSTAISGRLRRRVRKRGEGRGGSGRRGRRFAQRPPRASTRPRAHFRPGASDR